MATGNSSKNSLTLDENYLLTVAIDFGTTFSGYAYSFNSSKDTILMNKNWGEETGHGSYKTPTSVMTKPDGSFHSFGYQAEENYCNPESDADVEGYKLYRHFKMLLHNKVLNDYSVILSTSGHERQAVDIFTMALTYLKDHILRAIGNTVASTVTVSDIRWILTVPAIWTDDSKAFMRKAAYRAGLISEKNSNKLMFALEPEAASIYCRSLHVKPSSGNSGSDGSLTFRSGDKILIIDAGGGTIDITGHEIQFDGRVKEVITPSGGPWGGITVDERFADMLTELFGQDVIGHWKSAKSSEWLQLISSFESSKKIFMSENREKINVTVPYELGESFAKMQNLEKNKMVKIGLSFRNGYIIIKKESAMELFTPSIRDIVEHVKSLITGRNTPKLHYALLVGGFGQCKVLQDALQCLLTQHNIHLLIPNEAQLAIIKGAVVYGHDPLLIRSRIARFTYGTDCTKPFIEGVHNVSKKIIDSNGEVRCNDIFHIIVKKGQRVETGESYEATFSKSEETNDNMSFKIFKVDREDVMYTDEVGVVQTANHTLRNLTGSGADMKVTYGFTELFLEARDRDKGGDYTLRVCVDFSAH